MKRIVLLSMLSTIIVALSLSATADSKQSGKITLSNPVVVAGTQLQPGEYVVRWDGDGPGVQVTFVRDGKQLASAPGALQEKRSGPESITTHLHDDGTRVLSEMTFSTVTLVLPHPEMSR